MEFGRCRLDLRDEVPSYSFSLMNGQPPDGMIWREIRITPKFFWVNMDGYNLMNMLTRKVYFLSFWK